MGIWLWVWIFLVLKVCVKDVKPVILNENLPEALERPLEQTPVVSIRHWVCRKIWPSSAMVRKNSNSESCLPEVLSEEQGFRGLADTASSEQDLSDLADTVSSDMSDRGSSPFFSLEYEQLCIDLLDKESQDRFIIENERLERLRELRFNLNYFERLPKKTLKFSLACDRFFIALKNQEVWAKKLEEDLFLGLSFSEGNILKRYRFKPENFREECLLVLASYKAVNELISLCQESIILGRQVFSEDILSYEVFVKDLSLDFKSLNYTENLVVKLRPIPVGTMRLRMFSNQGLIWTEPGFVSALQKTSLDEVFNSLTDWRQMRNYNSKLRVEAVKRIYRFFFR